MKNNKNKSKGGCLSVILGILLLPVIVALLPVLAAGFIALPKISMGSYTLTTSNMSGNPVEKKAGIKSICSGVLIILIGIALEILLIAKVGPIVIGLLK